MNVNEQLGISWDNPDYYNQDEVVNGYTNGQQQQLTADENGWYRDEHNDKVNEMHRSEYPDWYHNSIVKDASNDWIKYRNDMYGSSNEAIRKAGGQFYTPPALALHMLRKFSDLPNPKDYEDADSFKKAMHNNTHTLLDPTAGAGSLLVPAILSGMDPKLVYALEEDPNKIGILRKRLKALGVPDKNIFMGSALNEDLLKKISSKADNDPYLKAKIAKLQKEKEQQEFNEMSKRAELRLGEKNPILKNKIDAVSNNRDKVSEALEETKNMSQQQIIDRIANGEADELQLLNRPARRYLQQHVREMGFDEAMKFIKSNLDETARVRQSLIKELDGMKGDPIVKRFR